MLKLSQIWPLWSFQAGSCIILTGSHDFWAFINFHYDISGSFYYFSDLALIPFSEDVT